MLQMHSNTARGRKCQALNGLFNSVSHCYDQFVEKIYCVEMSFVVRKLFRTKLLRLKSKVNNLTVEIIDKK